MFINFPQRNRTFLFALLAIFGALLFSSTAYNQRSFAENTRDWFSAQSFSPVDYLLILDLQPDGNSLFEQSSNLSAPLLDMLATYKQKGLLGDYSPFLEIGAVLLNAPDQELIAVLTELGYVKLILPATDAAFNQALANSQAVNQEAKQLNSSPTIEDRREEISPAAAADVSASFTVNNQSDVVDFSPGDGVCETASGNGVCTLRAAIQEANALAGGDSIYLPPGSYSLVILGGNEDVAATGDLDITGDLTIIGDSISPTVIQGGMDDRIFHVISGTVEMQWLTITGGQAYFSLPQHGGGILVDSGANLTVDSSLIRSNGGVIGGGIFSSGTLSILNSSIGSNNAESGGGIRVESGSTTITNSTIAYNSASAQSVGGGIQGNATLKNSILANNSGGTPDCAGTITSQGYNLIESITGCTITGDTTGNILGADPQLATLGNNGGPTQTYALSLNSLAIDAGTNSGCPAIDQRGRPRPVDGDSNGTATCDIGAFEFAYELTNFTVYLNDTRVKGQINGVNQPITLTLKTGSTTKSQINTVSNGSNFTGYFTTVIGGNDTIEVDIAGQTNKIVPVIPLTLQLDKATNIATGIGPANKSVNLAVYSWAKGQYSNAYPVTDGTGNFTVDFTSQTDVFIGDVVDLWAYDDNGYQFRIDDWYVPGMTVFSENNYVYGYAGKGDLVELTLKDNGGSLKAEVQVQANNNGYFYSRFPGSSPFSPGDIIDFQYGSAPVQSLHIVTSTIDTVDVTTDTVGGSAPANSKVEIYGYDEYQASRKTLVLTAGATGQFTADFSGSLDLLPGSYASVTYHDPQDNEILSGVLYAGPYARVSVRYWDDLWVVGQPQEKVQATLKNALGAVKGTAIGTIGLDGSTYLNFLDSTGSSLDVLPGDVVEIDYENSLDRTVEALGINFMTDRQARTVTGSAPPNSQVRLIYNFNTVADVTSDPSGNFSYTFSFLTGGYSMSAYYRNPQGDDLRVYGYVPQFTVTPESGYLYGYGPFNAAVVATLKDSSDAVKETRHVTSDGTGYYWLSFSSPINIDDKVVIDTGPLHYEQAIVPLTIAADTATNAVFGTAPNNAWLNVFSENMQGPYQSYNYRYFYADGSGNFSTVFGEVRGGDYLRVLYWEGGQRDRVNVYRNALPYLVIDHTEDRIYGGSTPGAAGTLTIRSSGGVVKTASALKANTLNGRFDFLPGNVDIVPGDQIEIDIGVLNKTVPVIPLQGALNLADDSASGQTLPNIPLGLAIYHWAGSYYSQYVNGNNLSQFITTSAGGGFNLDVTDQVDLQSGDYLSLYYYTDDQTLQRGSFFTTNPTVSVTDYPLAAQPGSPISVVYQIANGAHPTWAYVTWDTTSHAFDNAYPYQVGQQAAVGQNTISFNAPPGGTAYFKIAVNIDGRTIRSDEYAVQIDANSATTLFDPISGTTNDNTPTIKGFTAPGADVTLFQDGLAVANETAGSAGYVSFDISSPLAPGTYAFHAVATVGGVPGPNSNKIQLTIDPSLPVDPVHILITTQGQTQHLRDNNGYANLGGRIWTRTGESVAVSIPISYTNVYTADLYVGAVFATTLLDGGNDTYLGTYTPPTSGTYALDLKFRSGPSDPIQTINILSGLIDPDGYVYDATRGVDYRLAGAEVTCYELVAGDWFNWNAAIWSQINPQITKADGYYAFFTLPGTYKIKVSAPGYVDYESPPLVVVDEPVHHNAPLLPVQKQYLPSVVRQ